MVAVADLKEGGTLMEEWVLFIEGIPIAFSSGNELVGTSWISTTYGVREIRPGLVLPEAITVGTDFMAGKLRDGTVRFTILDLDDTLVDLFKTVRGDDEVLELGERLAPSETTAPATKLAPNYVDAVTIRDRHIGLEYIGPSGQRRHFWVAPSDVPAGLDHPAPRTKGEDIANPRVSTEPIEFCGRKVALYRMLYDKVLDTWPNWLQQYQAGGMRWFGTLRDSGQVHGREWSIECWGPASWFRKPLGQFRPEALPKIQPGGYLRDEQKHIAVWFYKNVTPDDDYGIEITPYQSYCTYHDGDGDNLVLTTQTTGQAITTHLRDMIVAVRSGTSSNVNTGADAWTDADGYHAEMLNDRTIVLSIADLGDFVAGWGAMVICMHEDVWMLLGYEPRVQRSLVHEDKAYVSFERVHGQHGIHQAGGGFTPPTDGYWIGHFSTTPGTVTWETGNFDQGDNDGGLRAYEPLWKGGTTVLSAKPGQKLKLGYDAVYLEGQKGWKAHTGSLVDGQQCNRVALILLSGKIMRASEDPQVEDYAQVLRISWVDDDGAIAPDSDGQATVIVEAFEDPRHYGLEYKRMTAAWVWPSSDTPTAYVLSIVGGYVPAGPDYRHLNITRLFLSSGTGTTYWPHDDEIPDCGINQPDGMDPDDIDIDYEDVGSKFWGGDLELQDFGCNIPPAYIDFDSVTTEASNLPAGVEDPLNRWRLAWIGSHPAAELFEQLLRGAGWAWGWRPRNDGPPQFSIFTPYEFASPVDVDDEMVESKKSVDPKNPKTFQVKQELRANAPVDVFRVSYRFDPLTGSSRGSKDFDSLDPARRHRMGNVFYRSQDNGIDDGGLSDPDLFEAGVDPDYLFWTKRSVPGGVRPRFQKAMGNFLAGRHFTLDIETFGGEDWGPGVLLRVTEPRVANPDGSYGITAHVVRVEQVTYQIRGKKRGSQLVKCLAHERAPTIVKLWAPSARVWGTLVSASKMFLAGSIWNNGRWLRHKANQSDALGWVKQDWMSGDGVAKAYLWQSRDGETWPTTLRCSMDIATADTDAHELTYTNLSGTIFPDTEKLLMLQPDANQSSTAWTRTHYSVVTIDDGTHGAGVQGSKLH